MPFRASFGHHPRQRTSPDGGIGRRAGLKHQWSNPCRFDPGSGYRSGVSVSTEAPFSSKMQVLDFQTLAFFFFLFAPHLHHVIEPFKPKSRHFHILSIKTALFVDSSSFLQTPSIKTAIFMDSKRLCTRSLGIW